MPTKQEQRKTVEYLKDAGILPPDQNPKDYPPLDPDQTWKGEAKSYTILSNDGHRVEVAIHYDRISGSTRPWSFTHDQFRALIEESDLRLHDVVAKIDDIAERLEKRNHKRLAYMLDQIVAKRGVNKRSRIVDQLENDLRSLTDQLERSKDPLNIARLTNQLDTVVKNLLSQGVDETPTGIDITPPGSISAPNDIARPNMITKGASDEDPEEDPDNPIKKRDGQDSTFVIGDDIIRALSDVATKLYDLDEDDLAEKVVNFLVDNI